MATEQRRHSPLHVEVPASRSLTDTEPNFRDLVENADDIIYALDLEGRFTYYNHVAWELLGHQPGEYLGRPFTDVLTPESAEIAIEHYQKGLRGERVSPFLHLQAVKRDGTLVDVEIRACSLYRDGHLVGRQGVAREITELKRLREEVATKAAQITLLEDRNRIARELYDTIAHIVFDTTGDPSRTGALLAAMRSSLVTDAAKSSSFSEIDLKIVELVSTGLSNAQIGEHVCLSAHTVKDRIRRIMDRLGARRRAELVAEAARRGLI